MVVCGENGKSSKERMPWGRSDTILGNISFVLLDIFPSYAQMLVPILPDGGSAEWHWRSPHGPYTLGHWTKRQGKKSRPHFFAKKALAHLGCTSAE